MHHLYILTFLVLFLVSCDPGQAPDREVAVLVLGGGTGGTAAGIQAARLGAGTLIVEPAPWLGGMLTAAGVSAIDGNHALPAGLWGAFRQALYAHYGGPEAVATGWVSHTLFEPAIGARILDSLAAAEANLRVWRNSTWRSIDRENGYWHVRINRDGIEESVRARILIDGTDLGDVAAAAGAAFDVGMDARAEVGESIAPLQRNEIVQDLTYVAILKDYGEDADRTIARPAGYDPAVFSCSCARNCDGSYDLACDKMLSYGKLPNNKYMINWPNNGNDYYANVISLSDGERAEVYNAAKEHTLRFVYYIQHELGFANLGLADDEYPTSDSLPFIPYHREGRRIRGIQRLDLQHVLHPYKTVLPLYRTGIAVGDYPIDHHHDQMPEAPKLDFPSVPSFNIPSGCLIPAGVEGLLIADKAISVTNIVNGASRLQPVVLQIGQAAGAMAALAVREGIPTTELDVRAIQKTLLEAGAYLMPFYDVDRDHPHFDAIQRIGATGLLRGVGEPFQWANRTWFYPDSTIAAVALTDQIEDLLPGAGTRGGNNPLTITEALNIIDQLRGLMAAGGAELPDVYPDDLAVHWESTYGLSDYDPERLITRGELAVVLDRMLDPFHLIPIDFARAPLSDNS